MNFSQFHDTNLQQEFYYSINNEIQKIFKKLPGLSRVQLSFYESSIGSEQIIIFNKKLYSLEEGALILYNEDFWALKEKIEAIEKLGGKPTKQQLQQLKKLENQRDVSEKDEEKINNFFSELWSCLFNDINGNYLKFSFLDCPVELSFERKD